MTKDQLSQARKRIEAEIATLGFRTGDMRQHLVQVSDTRASVNCDSLDYAKDEADLNTLIELNERDVAWLAGLRGALSRIETGTYGICDSCADDIDPKRMEACLTAAFCVRCQAQHESSHLRRTSNPSQASDLEARGWIQDAYDV